VARTNRQGGVVVGAPIRALIGAAHTAEGVASEYVCIGGCEWSLIDVGKLLRCGELVGPGASERGTGGWVVEVEIEKTPKLDVGLIVACVDEAIEVEWVISCGSHVVFGGDGRLVMVRRSMRSRIYLNRSVPAQRSCMLVPALAGMDVLGVAMRKAVECFVEDSKMSNMSTVWEGCLRK
jgi:hypothetical protein